MVSISMDSSCFVCCAACFFVFFFKAVLFPWFLLLEPLSLEMLEVKLLGEKQTGEWESRQEMLGSLGVC